jgi:hypothetical protein
MRIIVKKRWQLALRSILKKTWGYQKFHYTPSVHTIFDGEKALFSIRKCKNSHSVSASECDILRIFVKNRWHVPRRSILKMTWDHKKFHYIQYILYTKFSMRIKRFFSQRKCRKWYALSSLQYEILRLFVKNRWQVANRSILKMTWNHKNFHYLPPVHTIFDGKKTHFQPPKMHKIIFT